MKLTTNNIRFVKVLVKNGITYEVHVAMKSHLVSDSRTYVNYDENGTTVVADYPFEKLPKAVQKFIQQAAINGNRWSLEAEGEFVTITYR